MSRDYIEFITTPSAFRHRVETVRVQDHLESADIQDDRTALFREVDRFSSLECEYAIKYGVYMLSKSANIMTLATKSGKNVLWRRR